MREEQNSRRYWRVLDKEVRKWCLNMRGLEKSEGETSPMECGAEYHQWPHLGIKPNVYSDEWI